LVFKVNHTLLGKRPQRHRQQIVVLFGWYFILLDFFLLATALLLCISIVSIIFSDFRLDLLILYEFLHDGAQFTPSFKTIVFALDHDGLSLLFVDLDGACDDQLYEAYLVK